MDEINDVDDLHGMLPDEIVAVVKRLQRDLAAAQVALAEAMRLLEDWTADVDWMNIETRQVLLVRRNVLLASDPADRGRAVLEAGEKMAAALDRCMVGGNHIASALIGAIGPNHPEEITSYEQALETLWGRRADTDDLLYETWMCWKVLMEARDLAGGPDWKEAWDRALAATTGGW